MNQKIFLLVTFLMVSSAALQAQSLKELLYSGKLKSDTGSVVRKTDDLSTKIDTSTRKPPPPAPVVKTVVVPTADGDSVVTIQTTEEGVVLDSAVVAAPRDNDEVWKEYTETLISELKTEVLPNKKVKAGSYSVLLVYEIDLDGSININTVSTSPSNDFLEQQIKNRMTLTAPTLTPLLNQFGKPRKAIKRQTITLTK
ncbi:MAG: hypothetical protein NVV59_01920 [Chitinophagaceae bacterium]|nr:hypothetical protein [Chitinophagaceae bacterium]